IMQGLCWHVAAKMSLGFLCLFLVFSTGKDNGLMLPREFPSGKLFLSLFLHFAASCLRKENKKEKQLAVLATAELPAKSLDLAAINLTELVNGMLSTALRGTKKLFSLLSITSYSSFAFHKVSVTIYNISNAKNIDPGKFPVHYCYCLNNVTNDLTDFTALLVDIIGNSTSYLTEIFKSTSILSVRQSNDSDCIYICVMAGQTGKNLSDFLEILDKSPVINYTFSSNTSSDLGKYILGNKRKQEPHFVKLQEDPNKTLDSSAEHVWTFKGTTKCYKVSPDPEEIMFLQDEQPQLSLSPQQRCSSPLINFVASSGQVTSLFWGLQRGMQTSGGVSQGQSREGQSPPLPCCPWGTGYSPGHVVWFLGCIQSTLLGHAELLTHQHPQVLPRAALNQFSSQPVFVLGIALTPGAEPCRAGDVVAQAFGPAQSCVLSSGCPQAMLREPRVTSPPVTLVVQKINPCVMELCRFFQLCLCVGQRRYSRKEAMRYCVEYYSWFMKNASYVCERVKRVAYSHTLKQKCLKSICTSL
ncbi:HHLA1 protein, partial [Molothrus ater]|nr:HHLA1 protein [Molothrus ater]